MTQIDIKALNLAVQGLVVPLFWGAALTSIAVPIAGAIGTRVAGKILPKEKQSPVKRNL